MKENLKIIFFGSSTLSVTVLRELIKAGYALSGVVTQPDKKAGRHLRLHPTAVKVFAQESSIKVFTPVDLEDKTFFNALNDLHPDLFVVLSYGKILPPAVLRIPRIYPLNIHTSLLPKYRGAAPIQRAIINGESVSGVTIIRMNEKMDEGDIISQSEIAIDPLDDAISFEKKLAVLSCRQIGNVLKLIEEGKAQFRKQDNSQATFAPKLKKDSGLIDWESSAQAIYNQIRGCLPWPSAYTTFKGKRLKILRAKLAGELESGGKPGEIVDLKDKIIFVAAGKSAIRIETLQPESSKQLTSAEFISGSRLKIGDIFGS